MQDTLKNRLIGNYSGDEEGPILICTAGLHGNETAGIEALDRVFQKLDSEKIKLHGTITGFAGNLRALKERQRYMDHDLNRSWTPDRTEAIRKNIFSAEKIEDQEQVALLEELQPYFNSKRQVYFLDLHTTTANGIPFCCFGDTLRNREYARAVPIPKILGLEDQLEGSLTEYLNIQGYPTLVVEGGQHNSPESVKSLEASIWLVLEHLELITRGAIEEMSDYRQYLSERTQEMPDYIEITHRHEIHSQDEFQMNEGYLNFQGVQEGEYLARDRFGKIYAPFDGIILLPLYQGLGNDGFFIGRKISGRALEISSLLRKFRFDALLSAIPGIQTCKDSENTLVVNPEVLHSKRAEWLNLMGYRKLQKSDNHYFAKKRPE